MMSERLREGTLWNRLLRQTEHALRLGALRPIPTDYEFVEEAGVRFLVRVLSNLSRKDKERKRRAAIEENTGKEVNPFLPYEEDLFVADISDTHLALLNKFNVVEHHLLVVTRHFEDQEILLTRKDFEAMWLTMHEYPSLSFYNGGRVAGASQRHKHLQFVPLPLAREGPRIPIEPLLYGGNVSGRIEHVGGLPFRHAFVRFRTTGNRSARDLSVMSHELYEEMLRYSGMARRSAGNNRQNGPYNLLATTEWMLLVPRSEEFFEGVSVNSLGFAGALLVRNERELGRLKNVGPMTVLRSVALPGRMA